MDSLISDLTLMVTRDTLIVTKDIQEILPRPQQQSQNILQIDPVGIEDHAAAVKNLLDLDGAARAVVIYGFGGIGKTTLAEYVVSKFLSLGDLKLSVIRIDDKNLQITKLQEQIIFDVGGKRIDLKDPIAGQLELGDVLKNQPCFLLIDNVVDKKHVQDILPKKLSFPSRSRILITSRENNMRQVLDLECKQYSVECLPPETARKLLHQIILDGHTYKTNGKEKIDAVVDACGGVPLLLEVYGKHLRVDRTESAYEEALDSLRKGERGAYKEEDLSAKLLFVYHKMRDEDTKDAFLDICCFFHEWQKDEVSAIVGERELVALKRGALLKINEKNQVIVHDVIKVMGVGEAKQTRLQSLQDLKMALEENKNLNKIKGIWLPDNEVLFHLESKHLDAMCDSLRVLSIGDWIKPEAKFVLPKSLSKLDFNGCDQLKKLPQGFEHLSALTDLRLDGCKSLREFPKTVGGLRSLKRLSMEGCENLIELPEDLGSLSDLQQLNLNGCKNLKTLPEINVGDLKTLKELTILGCKSLVGLPTGFGNLSLLNSLDISGCESFVELPQSFGDLCNLSKLEVEANILRESAPEWLFDPEGVSRRIFGASFTKSIIEQMQQLNEMPNVGSDDYGEGSEIEEFIVCGYFGQCEIGREVETNAKRGRLDEEERELYWRAAGAELFYGQCELVDVNGQCIPSSEFTTTHDSFIFVIAWVDHSLRKFEPQVFQKMVERPTSERVPIIYVEVDYLADRRGLGRADAHCDEENIRKTLELLPDGSRAISSTHVKTRSLFGSAVGYGCTVIIADVKADEKGLKRFVHCNDISSEIWPHEPAEKITFLDNILELKDTLEFTNVCKSHGFDYFLRANDHSKVSIGALEGKVVAIFMCNLNSLEFFKLEECYNILQQKHCNFEAVWFPTWYGLGYNSGSYVRRIKSMPLLLVPDPLSLPLPLLVSMNERFSRVILLDENGRLVKDAKPLVLRWGAEAYPFSEEKIEELKRKEFDDMQRQSTLEFLLGDSELEDSLGATVAMDSLRGKVIFLYSQAYKVLGDVREAYKHKMAEGFPWVRLTFKGMITFFFRLEWLKGKQNSYLVEDSVQWSQVESLMENIYPHSSSLVVFDEDGKETRGRRKEVVDVLRLGLMEEEDECEEEKRTEVIEIMRNNR
eukprot:Gb_19985 [translate_table: standard]